MPSASKSCGSELAEVKRSPSPPPSRPCGSAPRQFLMTSITTPQADESMKVERTESVAAYRTHRRDGQLRCEEQRSSRGKKSASAQAASLACFAAAPQTTTANRNTAGTTDIELEKNTPNSVRSTTPTCTSVEMQVQDANQLNEPTAVPHSHKASRTTSHSKRHQRRQFSKTDASVMEVASDAPTPAAAVAAEAAGSAKVAASASAKAKRRIRDSSAAVETSLANTANASTPSTTTTASTLSKDTPMSNVSGAVEAGAIARHLSREVLQMPSVLGAISVHSASGFSLPSPYSAAFSRARENDPSGIFGSMAPSSNMTNTLSSRPGINAQVEVTPSLAFMPCPSRILSHVDGGVSLASDHFPSAASAPVATTTSTTATPATMVPAQAALSLLHLEGDDFCAGRSGSTRTPLPCPPCPPPRPRSSTTTAHSISHHNSSSAASTSLSAATAPVNASSAAVVSVPSSDEATNERSAATPFFAPSPPQVDRPPSGSGSAAVAALSARRSHNWNGSGNTSEMWMALSGSASNSLDAAHLSVSPFRLTTAGPRGRRSRSNLLLGASFTSDAATAATGAAGSVPVLLDGAQLQARYFPSSASATTATATATASHTYTSGLSYFTDTNTWVTNGSSANSHCPTTDATLTSAATGGAAHSRTGPPPSWKPSSLAAVAAASRSAIFAAAAGGSSRGSHGLLLSPPVHTEAREEANTESVEEAAAATGAADEAALGKRCGSPRRRRRHQPPRRVSAYGPPHPRGQLSSDDDGDDETAVEEEAESGEEKTNEQRADRKRHTASADNSVDNRRSSSGSTRGTARTAATTITADEEEEEEETGENDAAALDSDGEEADSGPSRPPPTLPSTQSCTASDVHSSKSATASGAVNVAEKPVPLSAALISTLPATPAMETPSLTTWRDISAASRPSSGPDSSSVSAASAPTGTAALTFIKLLPTPPAPIATAATKSPPCRRLSSVSPTKLHASLRQQQLLHSPREESESEVRLRNTVRWLTCENPSLRSASTGSFRSASQLQQQQLQQQRADPLAGRAGGHHSHHHPSASHPHQSHHHVPPSSTGVISNVSSPTHSQMAHSPRMNSSHSFLPACVHAWSAEASVDAPLDACNTATVTNASSPTRKTDSPCRTTENSLTADVSGIAGYGLDHPHLTSAMFRQLNSFSRSRVSVSTGNTVNLNTTGNVNNNHNNTSGGVTAPRGASVGIVNLASTTNSALVRATNVGTLISSTTRTTTTTTTTTTASTSLQVHNGSCAGAIGVFEAVMEEEGEEEVHNAAAAVAATRTITTTAVSSMTCSAMRVVIAHRGSDENSLGGFQGGGGASGSPASGESADTPLDAPHSQHAEERHIKNDTGAAPTAAATAQMDTMLLDDPDAPPFAQAALRRFREQHRSAPKHHQSNNSNNKKSATKSPPPPRTGGRWEGRGRDTVNAAAASSPRRTRAQSQTSANECAVSFVVSTAAIQSCCTTHSFMTEARCLNRSSAHSPPSRQPTPPQQQQQQHQPSSQPQSPSEEQEQSTALVSVHRSHADVQHYLEKALYAQKTGVNPLSPLEPAALRQLNGGVVPLTATEIHLPKVMGMAKRHGRK